ncbi:MAG: alkaline phosphatase family protein, partial [Cytophagales bacterium]|nr:alkaline phosphatase family protein [Cytophagales bacterium]
LLGEGLPGTGKLQLDDHYDGYELDTIRFPHDKGREFMHRIDETVTDAAVNCLKTKGPDLSWVYLEYTDDMGHAHGDGERFYRAVEKMDGQVGRIAEVIQYRQRTFGEDWLLIVTTDHGRDQATGKHHGGQTDRERTTWMVTDNARLNAYADAGAPGIVDLMPTLARHLGVALPPDVQREIDGVPLVGPVSLAAARATYADGKLTVGWQALEQSGTVKIWLSQTNHYQRGGKDEYRLLGEVPLSAQTATVAAAGLPAGFCKVVLQGTHNAVNAWVRTNF